MPEPVCGDDRNDCVVCGCCAVDVMAVLAAGAEKPDVGVANPKPDVVVAGLLKPKPVLGEEPNAGACEGEPNAGGGCCCCCGCVCPNDKFCGDACAAG